MNKIQAGESVTLQNVDHHDIHDMSYEMKHDYYNGKHKKYCAWSRAVASLPAPGGQEFHFPHFPSNLDQFFFIFPQTLLIFFLILGLRVGKSPTREGPGYATGLKRQ